MGRNDKPTMVSSSCDLKRKGETVPLLDGMIAATTLQHDLIVATRNPRDFQKTGVKTLNPFE